ncbi:MAG: hypothetical protein JNJ54_11670 [Myxococcaceae bacterium]|nr:hypothetical protein [Myxococcaceae bacterium]
MPWLFALVVTATPLRLVHVVQGVPVGVVELAVSDGRVSYRARHVFRDGERAFETSWSVDDEGRDANGLVSELWALSRRRPSGCLDVREERTGTRERLCLFEGGRGTLDGVKLAVRWDGAGALERVDVLDSEGRVASRFERDGREPRPGADPFAEGFPVEGRGPIVRVAPDAGVKVVPVRGVPLEERAASACLPAARAWLAAHATPGDVVQLGLVLEDGRAWPHAWVRRVDGAHVDPTVEEGGREARVYLAFPDAAGSLYLELASGSRRVVRSGK